MDLTTAPTGPFSPTDVHARLALLAGRWKGTAESYFYPGKPAEVALWEGTIATLVGGRFLRFTYTSHAMGQPTAGELTIAYETGDRLFRLSWIDSLHTGGGILVSESKPGSTTEPDGGAVAVISALGSYFAGEGQPRWGWRTELDDQTEGTLRIRMFNIKPGDEETLGVAVTLTREGGG